MKNKRFLAASFLIVLLSAARAWAGHVVWLDFSAFNLDSWDSVNGNEPPQATDLEAIRKQIIANMSKDYATFDITFTTSQPAGGRYTRVKILGTWAGGKYGCASEGCCLDQGCTGGGTWTEAESACEVYSGSLTTWSDFTGPNATTFHIANGISHSASHELGHIFGLEHCNAADDSITLGCDGTKDRTKDPTEDENTVWHIMASGESWGLTEAQRAKFDRFFSVHSERRLLAGTVQLRNHFAPLANVDGFPDTDADLVYGHLSSPNVMKWAVRLSSGAAFGEYSEWSDNAGNAGDIFLTGDVHGDGRADLVYGRIQSPTQVTWYVRKSNGSAFSGYNVWSADAGDAGDIFRLADVDKDGDADLVYGRAINKDTVRWFVRKSNGSSFGNHSTWADDAGDVGDLFFLADVDADGDADLVYSRAIPKTKVQWWVRRSDGSKFGSLETWHSDAGNKGDLMYVGDATGDGMADLVYGRVSSTYGVTWYVRPSNEDNFGNVEIWANDAGDAGDLFRLGDTTGDGKLDLMYGDPQGLSSLTDTPDPTQVRWFGRSSLGTSFSAISTWAGDAGDEGDCFP